MTLVVFLQTSSLDELQAAVDDVFKINLTSKIKEVSHKEIYVMLNNHLF